MMEIKSEDGQSCSIQCLDGQSEYCHIQIVTQGDNEDCYSENTFDTVKCHICNVEVPALCFETHNESEKHVTLKSIFQKVLERVSKQINISVINNDEDLDKDVYFCVPCSKIVRIENQPKHESSEYHVKSRRSIDVVHEFYKIFEENKGYVGVKEIGKEEILDEKRDLSANKVCTEIIQTDTKNNKVKDVTNEDKTKRACPANDHHTNTMKPSCTVEHLVQNEKNNKELTSEEKYFKDMIKKYNLKANLPIVDGDFIQVASPSGIKVNISRDHFHSYQSKVEGNRVYCQMCTTWSELGEESKHKVTEEHVRNIFLPVNEKFARSLNDYSIVHCLICNNVTRQNNEDLAKQNDISENDNVAKQNNISENDNVAKQNDISENDNVTKQNDIPKNDNVTKQNDIPKNDNAASSTVSNIANYAYIIDPLRPFRFADSTKNNVTCIVCDIDIPNDSRIITNHEGNSDHNIWRQRLLNFHTICKFSYKCECCKIYSSTESVWAHICTEQHTALLQKKFEILPDALHFYVHRTIERGGQGKMYRELYKMLLQCNKIKGRNGFWYCTFCELRLTPGRDEINHMFSAAHEKLLKIILSCVNPRKKRDCSE